jgi:hypothetical protein
MVESTQFAEQCAGASKGPLAASYIATELERLHLQARIATVNREARRRRQVRAFRHWLTFWPIAVGVLLAAYAPLLRDLAAGYASWVATLLFPLAALAGQHVTNLTSGTGQALAQFLLFAQFPLDGWLARRFLKHRPTVMSVCGQVACLHTLAVLYLGFVTGSFNQYLPN